MLCEMTLAFCLSQGMVVGTTTVDLWSSRGLVETNPILGRGSFSAKQTVNASAITAGVLVAEHFIVKKWPGMKKPLTWVNFGISGAHLGAMGHNFRQ